MYSSMSLWTMHLIESGKPSVLGRAIESVFGRLPVALTRMDIEEAIAELEIFVSVHRWTDQ